MEDRPPREMGSNNNNTLPARPLTKTIPPKQKPYRKNENNHGQAQRPEECHEIAKIGNPPSDHSLHAADVAQQRALGGHGPHSHRRRFSSSSRNELGLRDTRATYGTQPGKRVPIRTVSNTIPSRSPLRIHTACLKRLLSLIFRAPSISNTTTFIRRGYAVRT